MSEERTLFGISGEEFIIILIVILLFLGPRQIPRILRTLGNIMYEIRKTADEVRIALESEDEEFKKARDIYAEIEEKDEEQDRKLSHKKDGDPVITTEKKEEQNNETEEEKRS